MIIAAKNPNVNSNILPNGPNPSSRMIASRADPKNSARTATLATAIINHPASRFQIMCAPFARANAAPIQPLNPENAGKHAPVVQPY